MELMKHLRALTSGPDPVQIIATTHSPYILDYVEPEAVLVFAQTTEGTSMVRALAQHPDHQRLRGQLSAGQLWTLDEEADWMMKVGP
jgi:predicted ATPase